MVNKMLKRVWMLPMVVVALVLVARAAKEEGVGLENDLKVLRLAESKEEAQTLFFLLMFGANERVLKGLENNDTAALEFVNKTMETMANLRNNGIKGRGVFQVKINAYLAKGDSAERQEIAKLTGLTAFLMSNEVLEREITKSCLHKTIVNVSLKHK